MLLDLSEIVIRRGMKVSVDLDQPGVEDPDLVFAEPLTGHLKFENNGDLISIHGDAEAHLTVPCSRCLKDSPLSVDVHVEEHLPIDDVLHPNRPPEEGEEVETDISSIIYLDQGRPILDLDELMRQLIVSEIPIRTLCEEECKGLCPGCGANLNDEACRCESAPNNSPLAGLAALLEDDKA